MALTTRKGHAASVRRQSRQRLRSERRYRRNRFSRFIAALYESAVPSRDCHVGRWPPRNDKPLVFAILTAACFLRRCSAGPGCPLPYKTRASGTTFRFPVVLCGVFRYNRKGGTQIVKKRSAESYGGKESVKGNRQGVLSRLIPRRSGRIAKSCCKI